VTLLLCAGNAFAQWPTRASAVLPADHWSYAVLKRLDHAGLLPAGADIARQAIPQEEISALLAYVAAADSANTIAASYLHEFTTEFTPRVGGVTLSAHALYHMRNNHVLAGVGFNETISGARPVDDESDVAGLVRASFASRSVAASVAAAVGSADGGQLDELQLVLASGTFGVWGGRREIGYRAGHAAGLVVNATRFDGAGVYLAKPIRLPVVGALRYEMHLSKVDNLLNTYTGPNAPIEPFFWTARGSVEPHPRLRFGISRGIMFGGEGNVEFTASRFLRQLVGMYTEEAGDGAFANQSVSVDARWVVFKGRLPTTAYMEWAGDDGAGAWYDVPAFTWGLEVSGLPKRDIAVGIERTEFLRNTTNNSHWYQNYSFVENWTDGGELLGHPLAGHGKEWRVFASGGSPLRGITADIGVYKRWRGDNNLLAPQRQGSSIGAVIAADARVTQLIRVMIEGETESGSKDWSASSARAGLRFVF
jgi:hypothetical protein